MADIITPARRSAIMARIGPQDTVPEMAVRRLVLAMGLRFRLHRRDLPGRPDLVFPKSISTSATWQPFGKAEGELSWTC
jgi:DNA mismatch endonuclease, patch repair protein